eukprot:scaffold1803_cov320-Prasinococcus_capsulatus_cf.AAC.3
MLPSGSSRGPKSPRHLPLNSAGRRSAWPSSSSSSGYSCLAWARAAASPSSSSIDVMASLARPVLRCRAEKRRGRSPTAHLVAHKQQGNVRTAPDSLGRRGRARDGQAGVVSRCRASFLAGIN